MISLIVGCNFQWLMKVVFDDDMELMLDLIGLESNLS